MSEGTRSCLQAIGYPGAIKVAGGHSLHPYQPYLPQGSSFLAVTILAPFSFGMWSVGSSLKGRGEWMVGWEEGGRGVVSRGKLSKTQNMGTKWVLVYSTVKNKMV